jgi:hypothetical protein
MCSSYSAPISKPLEQTRIVVAVLTTMNSQLLAESPERTNDDLWPRLKPSSRRKDQSMVCDRGWWHGLSHGLDEISEGRVEAGREPWNSFGHKRDLHSVHRDRAMLH